MVWEVRSIPTGSSGLPLLLLWLSVDSNASAAESSGVTARWASGRFRLCSTMR